jgi:adenine-specific DNA-methyltransferase
MSHRYPRLLTNTAGVSFVNSMHGVRLRPGTTKAAKSALPLLVLNSVSMLGAELHGRSYGGGILKMEPREAAKLPVPSQEILDRTWDAVKAEKPKLDLDLRAGRWTNVAKRVDEILLRQGMGLTGAQVADLHAAVLTLRKHRTGS